MIRSGDEGAIAGGEAAAAAAPRDGGRRRRRRPAGRAGSGSGASPWWTPHPERRPASRAARPPPQGGGGSERGRGDPSGSLCRGRVRRRDGAGGCRRWKGRGRRLRRCSSQGRADWRAAGAGGGQPSAGCGRRRGPAEVPRTISRLAAGCPRGAPTRSALRGSLRRAPAGGRRQGAKWPSEPEGTVPSGGEEGRDQRSSAGPLLTPARGEPRGGRRKLSRRPLLPPREPGAPAGEAGEVVPRDFWGAREQAGGRADGRGARLRAGSAGPLGGGGRPKSHGPQANHCSSRSWAA